MNVGDIPKSRYIQERGVTESRQAAPGYGHPGK